MQTERRSNRTRFDFIGIYCKIVAMNGKKLIEKFVRGRSGYVLNQKAHIFKDKRTKRNRTRAEQRRKAIEEK